MIRFVFRFIGVWVLAAAFIALLRDGTNSIANKTLDLTKLGKFGDDWNLLDLLVPGASTDQLKVLIERYAGSSVWEFVSAYFLNLPTWLVLGVIGSLFILIGRKKKSLIGYGRD